MRLLDLFRKKKTIEPDFTGDIVKAIGYGIYFEDKAIALKWNEPIKDLAKIAGAEEKLFADRVVYNWGERQLLNGLKLNLTSAFWYSDEENSAKRFRSITFQAIGNRVAEEYLKSIGNHLENVFGPPHKNELGETEVYMEWVANGVKLSLRFFEQYANKLLFEISRQ